jgi:hypothetical protein
MVWKRENTICCCPKGGDSLKTESEGQVREQIEAGKLQMSA